MRTVDNSMSRHCNRLMSNIQQLIDSLAYNLEEMEWLQEQNPEREDIKACIDDIKTKVKAAESTHWVLLNNWSEHFDSVTQGDHDKEKQKTDDESKEDD